MPATQTTASMRPNASTALCTIEAPPSIVVTLLGVRDGLAARRLDLAHHRVGDLARRRGAVHRHAVVVDHDAARRSAAQVERHRASDAAPGARHRHRLAVEDAHQLSLLR